MDEIVARNPKNITVCVPPCCRACGCLHACALNQLARSTLWQYSPLPAWPTPTPIIHPHDHGPPTPNPTTPACPQARGFDTRADVQAFLFDNPDYMIAAVHFIFSFPTANLSGGNLTGLGNSSNPLFGQEGAIVNATDQFFNGT